MRRPRCKFAIVAVLLTCSVAPLATWAQDRALPQNRVQDTELLQFRQQVEMWIRSGQTERAIELLEQRRTERGLETSLSRRLASLYREVGRFADLEAFVLESSGGQLDGADVGQLRLLAEARFRQDHDDAAREVLDLILERDPGDPSLLRLVATVLSQNGHLSDAVRVLITAREEEGDANLFAQLLARFYTQLEQPADALSEYARVVISNPLNISLVRGQLLQLVDRWPEAVAELDARVQEIQATHPDVVQLSLLAAELRLRAGRPDEAWEALSPHMADSSMAQELLRLALAGLADSRSRAEDEEAAMRRLRFSARIAQGLLDAGALPRSLQPRAWDTLTRTLMALLENPAFLRQDPQEQLLVLEQTRGAILTMQRSFAGNRLTASALLRLAELYSTSLHRPQRAIEIYGRIADDPGATLDNIKLARMGLAQSYVALGDTATARAMFDEIGADMSFVEGQGRAQYYLGQIDFMGGHFAMAEDRLKAVAAESPRADYANDALDLALILAEENMSGAANEEGLRHYGEMLYHRSVAQSARVRRDLRAITDGATETPLSARARYDLARLDFEEGDAESALESLTRLQERSPASRYLPAALEWKGEVYESLGRGDEAMKVYEELLVDHDEYVHLDRVRDRIRELERSGIAVVGEDDLP
jgi:tetratricopeptide (TPR) repeat protein